MNQSSFKQKEISQILFKPNFQEISESEEGFQKCGFLYLSRDFIPPKSLGLIGLTTLGASLLGNLLVGKGAIATKQGRGKTKGREGTTKAGEGTIRAGQDFQCCFIFLKF